MNENVGKNIKFYRKQRGLTQDQLSEAVGFSTQNLKSIESGTSLPSMDSFIGICQALDVPADFLLSNENKKFQIAATAQMMEHLSKIEDEEFNAIAKSIEMIYFYKAFGTKPDAE